MKSNVGFVTVLALITGTCAPASNVATAPESRSGQRLAISGGTAPLDEHAQQFSSHGHIRSGWSTSGTTRAGGPGTANATTRDSRAATSAARFWKRTGATTPATAASCTRQASSGCSASTSHPGRSTSGTTAASTRTTASATTSASAATAWPGYSSTTHAAETPATAAGCTRRAGSNCSACMPADRDRPTACAEAGAGRPCSSHSMQALPRRRAHAGSPRPSVSVASSYTPTTETRRRR